MMAPPKKELSSKENAEIGVILGTTEILATQPLAACKIHLQLQKPIPRSLSLLYKGVLPNVIGFAPITAGQLGGTEWLKKHLFPTSSAAAAFSAGVLSSSLVCPVEKVVTTQNAMPKLSLSTTLRAVLAQGPRGIFAGLPATAIREGVFSLFSWSVPRKIKERIQPRFKNERTAELSAGLISGALATVATQPADTIKTKQQASLQPIGFFKAAKEVGVPNLFKGILPGSCGMIVSVTLMSWLREELERYYKHQDENTSPRLSR